MLWQIQPSFLVDNKTTDTMIENLYNYKPPYKRLETTKKDVIIHDQITYCFEMEITKNTTTFYFSCDDEVSDLAKSELDLSWKSTLIESDYKHQFKNPKVKLINTHYHHFLSLKVDNRVNSPIFSMLEIRKILKSDMDKVLLQIVFQSEEPTWYVELEKAIKDFKKGSVKKKFAINPKTITEVLYNGMQSIFLEVEELANDLLGTNAKSESKEPLEYELLLRNGLSNNTTNKPKWHGYITQIRVVADCEDECVSDSALRGVCNALLSIDGDNHIQVLDGKPNILKYITERKFKWGIGKTVLSSAELGQIIQLPTRQFQRENRVVAIQQREFELDRELASGTIPMGNISFRGKKNEAKWYNNEIDMYMLPKCYMGGMGSGKTSAIENLVIENALQGYSNFVIDFNDGKLYNNIKAHFPQELCDKDKIVEIDFSNDKVYRLGFNELLQGNLKSNLAIVCDYMQYFIDSVNEGDEKLSVRMTRYFTSATRICMANGFIGIKDIKNCLEDRKFRDKLIEKSQGRIRPKIIEDMLSLNKGDDETKSDIIKPITDRLTKIETSDLLEDVFMQTPNENIDFYKWSQEGKTVLIKIPKAKHGNLTTNIIVTFITLKFWASMLLKMDLEVKDRLPTFLYIDEPHSVPGTQNILMSACKETRKYRVGLVYGLHRFEDLSKDMRESLYSAGFNLLMFNTSKENVKELLPLFNGFDEDDLINIEQYHFACSLVGKQGRIVQTIKALPPVSDRFKKNKFKYTDTIGEEMLI